MACELRLNKAANKTAPNKWTLFGAEGRMQGLGGGAAPQGERPVTGASCPPPEHPPPPEVRFPGPERGPGQGGWENQGGWDRRSPLPTPSAACPLF